MSAASAAAPARLLVISPHLDDAVFSAGALLAAHRGSHVVTVFAGVPADRCALSTDWDRRCGFADAATAMRTRRDEDRRALEPLSAHPHWLDFLDAQYAPSPSAGTVGAALREALAAVPPADAVLMPIGLFHGDHVLTHEACLQLQEADGDGGARRWFAYEDALYRRKPGLLQERLVALARRGIVATPWFPPLGSPAVKAGAVQAYSSQLRAFGPHGYDDVAAPERYWRLERRRPGPRDDASETAG